MDRPQIIYSAYVLLFLLINASFLAIPYLAFSEDMGATYKLVRDLGICHQKISRSLCLFGDGLGYWISDCTKQNGSFAAGSTDRVAEMVEIGNAKGYKMPVCARDFGIYAAMLLAALAYPFVRRLDEKRMYPALYLLLAMVPIALDGGIQFLSDVGWVPFSYESTNAMRILTGAIAGAAASFYAIPLTINLFSGDGGPKKRAKSG